MVWKNRVNFLSSFENYIVQNRDFFKLRKKKPTNFINDPQRFINDLNFLIYATSIQLIPLLKNVILIYSAFQKDMQIDNKAIVFTVLVLNIQTINRNYRYNPYVSIFNCFGHWFYYHLQTRPRKVKFKQICRAK